MRRRGTPEAWHSESAIACLRRKVSRLRISKGAVHTASILPDRSSSLAGSERRWAAPTRRYKALQVVPCPRRASKLQAAGVTEPHEAGFTRSGSPLTWLAWHADDQRARNERLLSRRLAPRDS